nr:hypothetical protein [Acinetobacter sp. Marseille-Q1620]
MSHATDLSKRIKYAYSIDWARAERFPNPDGTVFVSHDNTVVYANLAGQTLDDKNNPNFGVYEAPLSQDALKKIEAMNSIFRNKNNDEYLNNNQGRTRLSFVEYNRIKKELTGKSYITHIQNDNYKIEGWYSDKIKKRLGLMNKINDGLNELIESKFANDSATKKISTLSIDNSISYLEKEHGLEIVVSYKNIGNYDINITSPYQLVEEPKTSVLQEKTLYDCWLSFFLGGIYKDESVGTLFSLLPKYLNLNKTKLDIHPEDKSITIPANKTVSLYYFIPNDEIEFYKDINDYQSEKYKLNFKLIEKPNYLSYSYLQVRVGPFSQYFYWSYGNKDASTVR